MSDNESCFLCVIIMALVTMFTVGIGIYVAGWGGFFMGIPVGIVLGFITSGVLGIFT